jgi:hypothetical protein
MIIERSFILIAEDGLAATGTKPCQRRMSAVWRPRREVYVSA